MTSSFDATDALMVNQLGMNAVPEWIPNNSAILHASAEKPRIF